MRNVCTCTETGKARVWSSYSYNPRPHIQIVLSLTLSINMEAVMTIVMKHCASELEEYASCVSAHPQTWNADCEELKLKAADCSSNSPAVQKINKVCAHEYAQYEKCLSSNPETVEVCVNQLQSFIECAEAAASKIPMLPESGK